MGKQLISIITILGLLLTGSIALAQDTPAAEATPVFCGDLAEADCTLLQQSSEAMNNLSSATFNFDFQMTFSGIDEEVTEPQTLSVTGDGSFTGRPAGAEMQPSNPMAMFSALGELKADLSLSLNLPPMLTEEMASEVGASLPGSIDLEMRLVDGVGYLNVDALRPFLDVVMEGDEEVPPEFANLNGWVSLDIVQLIGTVMAENPEIMSQMSMGMMNSQNSALFTNPSAFSSAATIERGADMNGAATFVTTLDFAALASDPAFLDLIRSEMEVQGETVTDEQLQAGLGIMSQMGEAITFSTTQAIDPATGYVQNMTFDMTFDFSQMAMMEMDEDTPAPSFALTGSVNLADFDSAPDITAPENVTPLPEEFYESLWSGMMGDVGGNAVGGVTSPDVEVPAIEIPTIEIPTIEIPTIEIPTIEIPVIGATETPSS
jgi:hypothetical protein